MGRIERHLFVPVHVIADDGQIRILVHGEIVGTICICACRLPGSSGRRASGGRLLRVEPGGDTPAGPQTGGEDGEADGAGPADHGKREPARTCAD